MEQKYPTESEEEVALTFTAQLTPPVGVCHVQRSRRRRSSTNIKACALCERVFSRAGPLAEAACGSKAFLRHILQH